MSHKLCKIQTDLLHLSVTQIYYPTWNHVEHCWWAMQGKSLAFRVTSSFEDTILWKHVFSHALIFVVLFYFLLGLFLVHFSSRFSSSSVMALAESCTLTSAQPSLLLACRSSHSRWGLSRSYSGCHSVKLLSGMRTWSKPRLSRICRVVPKTWTPVSKKHASWFCSHGDQDSFGHVGMVPAAPQFPVHGNAWGWGWGWQGSQQGEWYTAIRTSVSRSLGVLRPVNQYSYIRAYGTSDHH